MDNLFCGIIKPLNCRFVFAETSKTAEDAIKLHGCDPLAGRILADAINAACLLSTKLVDGEYYSIKQEYAGALGTIISEVDAQAQIRTLPGKNNIFSTIDNEDELFGKSGKITILKVKNGKVMSSGVGEAARIGIVDDIAFQISTADKVETEMVSVINFNPDPENPVQSSVALMLQALPDCDLSQFELARELIHSDEFTDIAKSKQSSPKRIELLMQLINTSLNFNIDIGEFYSIAPGLEPTYNCRCSKDSMRSAVKTLGKSELEKIFLEQEKLTINCQFCKESYTFTSMEEIKNN